MAKITLNPNPTFKLKVKIPVPGKGNADIEFTFKHHPREKLIELMQIEDDQDVHDAEYLSRFVSDWDLEDKFNEDNFKILLDNYPRSAHAIISAYSEEMTGSREKN
ncbi:phage tail assembly chaperone [Thorsellia anophelis]|uniref:Phage tail assembly chaperone n=1 Tax=Thorsellia anophelis DSM 18579 TaxID=1123402 RepID=A0A1I0D7D4_9GAMM|nr:phage tail assembly chaperone [Thorsellia anophelis]SET28158.1 Phage tail assembly chaperone [Thorsellia anophelis DSM 18579]